MKKQLSIRKLTKRERAIATVTGVIFAIAALHVYVVEPIWFAFGEDYKQATEREAELAELVSLTEHRSEIEAAYEQLRGSLTSNDSSENRPSTDLQRDVGRLVNKVGMTLANISPLNTVQGAEFDRFGAQFEVRGENHEFVRLLRELQDERELLYCDSINLTARAGADPITATFRVSRLTRKDR